MADLLKRLQRALTSRYRIERELGRGGMATVYLAQDLKHDCPVAIKVLDPEVTAAIGPERFLREVKTVARLTHPHILPLHDSGDADGLLFYVMPYVEGGSLRARLEREKQLPGEDALRVAHEVAEALSYAHGRGVVHRDIKPENILLESGQAVVADFGIARAIEHSGGENLTKTGIAVGTPAYMSPEQAAGSKDLDGRSDLYALGCVLYEMLAGQPPFTGLPESLVYQHLSVAPRPVTDLRPAVVPAVREALAKALAKTPADRFATTAEFSAALAAGPEATPASKRRGAPWMTAGVAGLVIAVVAVAAWREWWPFGGGHVPEPIRRQLTYEGNVWMARLSPDGQYLAYVLTGNPGKLMLKDLAGGASLVVADSVRQPFNLRWSPDGTRLGFAGRVGSHLGLYVFPRLGGTPERAPFRQWFAWSPDGARMARWSDGPLSMGIEVTSLRSGERDSLPIPGSDDFAGGGDWSPTGRLLALTTYSGSVSGRLWVLDLENKSHVLTVADSVKLETPTWAADARAIYYLRDDELYRIAVDPRSGRAKDVARRLLKLEDTRWARDPISISTFARGGPKLAYTRQNGHWNYSVARVDADGRAEHVELTTGTANKLGAVLSPDGSMLAFLQQSDDGWDLYRVPAVGGPARQLTFGGAAAPWPPAWDPSGQRLAFAARVGARHKVAVVHATGGQPRVFNHTQVSGEIVWAPSPRIAYQLAGNRNFSLLDPGTGAEQLLVRNDSVGWMFTPRFSPDGSRVAVFWSRMGGLGVWLVSLVDSSQTLLRKGWMYPLEWSADGRSLYVRDSGPGGADNVWRRLPTAAGEGVVLRPPKFEETSCVPYERPSGVVWVCAEGKSWTDAWMIENFDPEYAGLRPKQGRRAQRRP